MRLARVAVDITEPLMSGDRILELGRIAVTVDTPAEGLGGRVWLGGRSITVETSGSTDRAHLETTLAFALNELEKVVAEKVVAD